MNISHFKILIAVAEQGSFLSAALQLWLSQSSVSRAIASLEEELGFSLLARGRFGAHPFWSYCGDDDFSCKAALNCINWTSA